MISALDIRNGLKNFLYQMSCNIPERKLLSFRSVRASNNESL
jgi:hypothetical protein